MAWSSLASLGSIGVTPFFHLSPLSNIVSEWAALIPLIVHLASIQDDHRMIGEVALNCHVRTGLFPRLGHLHCIAKLLRGGPDFVDRVSSTGTVSSVVWDVSWGSVFPCANGGARDLLTASASRKSARVIDVDRWTVEQASLLTKSTSSTTTDSSSSSSSASPSIPAKKTETAKASTFSRPQLLHVITCRRQTSKLSISIRLGQALQSFTAEIVGLLTLLGLVVVLCLFGCYGTAQVVVSGGISKLVCHFVPIQRPPGYLQNNECHDACMLTAIHENASVWCLYRGDRSVVDWVLNKTVIVVPPSRSIRLLYHYFRLAHCHQLLAMTYVAAQKGWDGVCLLCLMIVVWAATWLFDTTSAAAEWMQREHVGFTVSSFEFTGRTAMIGAVQMISDRRILRQTQGNAHRNTTWMDPILAPCARRDCWTARLLRIATDQDVLAGDLAGLDPLDGQWVEKMTKISAAGARCVASETAADWNGEAA